ncbi:MAG TPA: tryptophan--tRNA ligase [Micromonosporaceae bacterium]
MPRRLTGLTPSGELQLGNYFGAIRPMLATAEGDQTTRRDDGPGRVDSLVMVSDLHALTVEHDPADVRQRTLRFATLLLAAGIDPEHTTVFVQSHVPEHTELHYLLECATAYGEAHRMIQFKQKSAAQQHVRLSLLTYPVLMAADILLYDIDEVPVGEDQTQHVELARDVATRFNARYGRTFVVPQAVNPPVAGRMMDLSDPTVKMSKSAKSPGGVLRLLDPPDVVRRKVARAVTDPGSEVRYEPTTRPGVANLLDILASCTGERPEALADRFTGYRDLKAAVADAVIDVLAPIRTRYQELTDDPGYLRDVLRTGAERARGHAAATLARTKEAVGLVRL